jgi:hypothetical protein
MAVVAMLVVVTGCDASPVGTGVPRPSPTELASSTVQASPSVPDLWLLVGPRGDRRLVRFTSGGLDSSPRLPDPPGDTRWASGDLTHGFVASVGSAGRIVTLEAGADRSASAWRPLVVTLGGGSDTSPAFSTLSPDGRRIAATLGDQASGAADAALLLIDPPSGHALRVALDGRADGRPPTWLGNATVVVAILDRSDAPTLAVVDTATGTVGHLPSPGGAFAASGDGRAVAGADRGSSHVRVAPTAALDDASAWASASEGIEPPAGAVQAGQLLLDHTGSRLAVAWLGAAGDPVAVAVYGRTGDRWAARTIVPLPGGTEELVLVGFDP